MDQRLINVARAGDIAGLYALLGDDQYILDKIDKVPFVDTPLHYAVLEGKTPFAMEVARLKPSFTRKHNKDGFSPMHLASKMGNVVIVKKLLAFDSDLCLVKGREWFTPLHCAAIEGKVEVINELLSLDACPKSIVEDLTVYEETALHLAAKNSHLEACRVLLEWLKQLSNQGVLQWKEDNIKTAMAAAGSHEVKELLVCEIKVNEVEETNVINANHTLVAVEEELGMAETRTPATSNTAGVVAPGNGDDDDREYLTLDEWVEFFKFKRGRDSPSEARTGLLVVAVLITTATYQAVQSPPGGFWQDTKPDEIGVKGHTAGKTILGTNGFEYGFLIFIIANTAGFLGSLFMIHILTEGFPLRLEFEFIMLALIFSYDFAMVSIIPADGKFFIVFFICSIILPLVIAQAAKQFRKVRILRRQGCNIWYFC